MENKKILKIKGMGCTSCALRIENSVKKLKGVKEIQVNFIEEKALLRYDPEIISLEKVIEKIREIGYDASIEEKEEDDEGRLKKLKRKIIISFLSGIFLLLLGVFKSSLFLEFILATPFLLYVS
ncbi:MAG: cation transporter [candidate division WOR-3 bacterium]